ncbi:MAG: hypothetical protein QXT13_11790 [Pyrobaculum sp.]
MIDQYRQLPYVCQFCLELVSLPTTTEILRRATAMIDTVRMLIFAEAGGSLVALRSFDSKIRDILSQCCPALTTPAHICVMLEKCNASCDVVTAEMQQCVLSAALYACSIFVKHVCARLVDRRI